MEHETKTPVPQKQLLFALGMCAKAGKLVFGTPMILEALRGKKQPFLVVCADDNSPATAKRLQDKCSFYRVERATVMIDGAQLAHAVGKTGHLAAVAVTDEQLARLVKEKIGKSASEKNEQDRS